MLFKNNTGGAPGQDGAQTSIVTTCNPSEDSFPGA